MDRTDWPSAYRHLEHNLYLFDETVRARALAMLADHPEIADAARESFSQQALTAYAQTHPGEYPWVEIRLEIFEDYVASPQEATWARNNVAEVYADEIALLSATKKQEQASNRARRVRRQAIQAERDRRSIARTCGHPMFGGICLGESAEALRQRLPPRIDSDDGTHRRLVIDVGATRFGVIARDGQVVAILRLFPSTSWLDFATQKLRLERAFGAKWRRLIQLPEEARDREGREQAIRDGRGLLWLSTPDETLVLSLRGPEGIRLANLHPGYSDTFLTPGDTDAWRMQGMLSLLQAPIGTGGVERTDAPVATTPPPPEPVVAVVFRRGTSVLGSTGDHGPTEAEEHFTHCVQQAISDARPSIRLLESAALLEETDSGKTEALIRASPGGSTTALPLGVNTLVLVDGGARDEEWRWSDGLFFCGGGYGGAGCLGLAQYRSPYRLSVTVIDAVDWRALQQFEASTNEERTVAVGYILPVWWTFGPDWAECTDIGRRIAEYLVPAKDHK